MGGVGAVPGRPGAFGDAADSANSIMNPGLDAAEQETAAYGYPPMVGQPHNGTGGDAY